MGSRRRSDSNDDETRRPPAPSFQGRENELVNLAVQAAEKQIRDGTASSQIITHYLKLGSSREMLEQERLRYENDFLKAKTEMLASQERQEELFAEAIKAMTKYQGGSREE